jgi:hypothetical protein
LARLLTGPDPLDRPRISARIRAAPKNKMMTSPVPVNLPPESVAEALALADASFQRNERRRGCDEHYANTPWKHKVGKLGELGCALALAERGVAVVEIFRDPQRENEADLLADQWRLEVKTWSERFWGPGGRCVRPNQLPDVSRKADGIVWCTVEGRLDEGRLFVRGWSTPDDVAGTEPRITTAGQQSYLNHQVKEEYLRDFEDLLSQIRNGPPGSA